MESMFRGAIPERHGTQIVFRQGSPLDPGSLRMVAASKARAVIITSDAARCVRCATAQREVLAAYFAGGARAAPACLLA